jgi:hypothetical protein
MYGQLPSTVLATATTYDLMVMDTLMTWENQQLDKASGKPQTPQLSQEQMMEMVKSVKNKKK